MKMSTIHSFCKRSDMFALLKEVTRVCTTQKQLCYSRQDLKVSVFQQEVAMKVRIFLDESKSS